MMGRALGGIPMILGMLLLSRTTAATTASKPHIIFVMGDDAGWNDFGFTKGIFAAPDAYVGPQSKTPALDTLAYEGIILKRHYAYRYCSPSRGAFLTGRLPYHVHEVNGPIAGCANLRYTMLPAKLAAAGYISHQVGKWHEGLQSMACIPVHRGFNTSFGYLFGAEDHVMQNWGHCTTGTRQCGDPGNGGGCVDLWRNTAPAFGENGTYNDYAFTHEAEQIIAAHPAHTPLFLYQAFQNVHGPYEVPAKYRGLFPADESCAVSGGTHDCCGWTEISNTTNCKVASKEGICKCPNDAMSFQPPTLNCPPGGQCTRNYMLAMLAALDDSVGNVVAALKQAKLYDNAVIIFSSDNGGAVADIQQGAMNNFPLRGGKSSYFEGGVRAAAFVHSALLPAAVRGTICGATISMADWWATFAVGLAGLDRRDPGFNPHHVDHIDDNGDDAAAVSSLPKTWGTGTYPLDSLDMWPLLMGLNLTHPRTEMVIGQLEGGAMVRGDMKYINGTTHPDWWYGPHSPNCTNGLEHHATFNCGGGCLFNLTADPTEHVNLKHAQPDIFAELAARFAELTDGINHQLRADMFAAAEPGAQANLCNAMWSNRGFYRPYDNTPA